VPILPISDGNGSFLPTALSRLSTIMSNPQIGEGIDSADQSALARAISLMPAQQPVLIYVGDIAKLMETARTEKPDGRLPEMGLLAYFVLMVNLICAEHRPKFVSVQRAAFALPGKSRTTVLRAWKAFGCVSHLWVAISYKPANPNLTDWQVYLKEFLAYAEWLRERGEHIYAHGRSTPILDSAQTWKCPPDIELPAVEPEMLPLEGDLLAKLKKYRAPRSPS
jgi:hypothetical protein